MRGEGTSPPHPGVTRMQWSHLLSWVGLSILWAGPLPRTPGIEHSRTL